MKSKTKEDHELSKFTQQSQIKITGHAVAKVENTFDAENNLTISKEYKAARHTTVVTVSYPVIPSSAFKIYAQDSTGYYIWFTWDGSGSDPSLSGTGIQVDLLSGNTDKENTQLIVTTININITINKKIKFKKEGTYDISIRSLNYGVNLDSTDTDSGFDVVNKIRGTDYELVAETQISYDVNDNPTTVIRLDH